MGILGNTYATGALATSRGWQIIDGVVYVAYTREDIHRLIEIVRSNLSPNGNTGEQKKIMRQIVINFRTIEDMMRFDDIAESSILTN